MSASKRGASPTLSTGAQLRFALEQAEYSGETEGLQIDPATRAAAVEWTAGRIVVDELVARGRSRFGLKRATASHSPFGGQRSWANLNILSSIEAGERQ